MSDRKSLLCPERETVDKEKATVLFVCTGNTCRSPMAQALFNHIYNDGPYTASSAGLAANGSPISDHARDALMERGVLPTPTNDYLHHTSRMLSAEMLEDASLVVGLTSAHAMGIIMRYPAYASKVTVMPNDISDPYGGSLEDYRHCLEDIETALGETFAAKEGDDHCEN